MKKLSLTIKTISTIMLIILITYSIMAVITHFSLNYKLSGYVLSQSLASIFDFSTDIFRFFLWFFIINATWLSAAIIIRIVIKRIKN